MSYQLIPNIIFILSIAGIIIIILRALPAAISDAKEKKEDIPVEEKLQDKGLPALAISKLRGVLRLWGKKTFNFILEAKDVAPDAIAGYKIKKIFRGRQPEPSLSARGETRPAQNAENTGEGKVDESHFLQLIKKDPRNLDNYYRLGRLYISQEKFQDAADIFQYLSSHQPTNGEYHSKEALCYYRLKQFDKAVTAYEKAIALDNAQPNRYYNLGLSAEAAGDEIKAMAAFEKAISLEPGNGKYYISLSNIHVKRGDPGQAVIILQSARSHDPNNLEIVEKLNGAMSLKT